MLKTQLVAFVNKDNVAFIFLVDTIVWNIIVLRVDLYIGNLLVISAAPPLSFLPLPTLWFWLEVPFSAFCVILCFSTVVVCSDFLHLLTQ